MSDCKHENILQISDMRLCLDCGEVCGPDGEPKLWLTAEELFRLDKAGKLADEMGEPPEKP